MKSYRATYIKKNGEVREIHFVKVSDLPQQVLAKKVKGNATVQRELTEGFELVWDLVVGDFRVFNWKTVEGVVKEEEVNFVV